MAPTTRSNSARSQETISPASSSHGRQSVETIDLDEISTNTSTEPSPSQPPIYTIDLSLPPAERYTHVLKDYENVIEDLPELFDEIIEIAHFPSSLIHLIAPLALRKVHSKDQTQELKGIEKTTGVPMYLLVAYNVLLDLLMGCSSGGVLVKEPGRKGRRMMHYRTLDWGMPSLRRALVQYEFKSSPNGEVIARTIGYVGHVGVLTGVKKGLSMSLNFRPYHNNDHSKWSNVKFYGHILLVLLGFRPSICAHLRDIVIPASKEGSRKRQQHLKQCQELGDIALNFPSIPTTAAYLIFCDGAQTIGLEKDLTTAKILASTSFLALTNHDTSYENSSDSSKDSQAEHKAYAKVHQFGIGMEDIMKESINRKDCIVKKWESRGQKRRKGAKGKECAEEGVELETLKEWVLEYPVSNDQTHFSCIMDPERGVFEWVRSFEEGEIVSEQAEGDDEDEAPIFFAEGEVEESPKRSSMVTFFRKLKFWS